MYVCMYVYVYVLFVGCFLAYIYIYIFMECAIVNWRFVPEVLEVFQGKVVYKVGYNYNKYSKIYDHN